LLKRPDYIKSARFRIEQKQGKSGSTLLDFKKSDLSLSWRVLGEHQNIKSANAHSKPLHKPKGVLLDVSVCIYPPCRHTSLGKDSDMGDYSRLPSGDSTLNYIHFTCY
jgi:hypothetical protein